MTTLHQRRVEAVAKHLEGWVLDPETLAATIVTDLDALDRPGLAPWPARSTDPATSHRGAVDVVPRANSQRRRLLAVYWRTHEPLLDIEAASMASLGRRSCYWKRVSELVDGGFLHVVGERLDPGTGSMARECAITQKGAGVFGG